MGKVGGEERFGDVVEAGEGDVIGAGAESGQGAFDGGLAEDGFQAFANGGKNHAGCLASLVFEALEADAWSGVEEGLPGQVADGFEDGGGGVIGNNRDGDDFATSGFHFFAADDFVAGPVAAFYENVGEQGGDGFAGSWLVVDDDGVDAFESGEDFGAFLFRNDGAAGAFELADAGVAVEADDENVAEGAGGFKVWTWPGWSRSKQPLVKTSRWDPP